MFRWCIAIFIVCYLYGFVPVPCYGCEGEADDEYGEKLLAYVNEAIEDVATKRERLKDLVDYACVHQEVLGEYYDDVLLLSTMTIGLYDKLENTLKDFKIKPDKECLHEIIAIGRVSQCIVGPLSALLKMLGVEIQFTETEKVKI